MSLESAVAFAEKVNKEAGTELVLRASELVIPRVYSTGSLAFDVALGGGWPGNRWTEVLGNESAGKTATVFKTIAVNQALDPEFTTFWLASEHYDTAQAARLGVDNNRVIAAPMQRMEAGLDLMLDAVEAKAYSSYVLDSFPAMIPDEEYEKAMDEASMTVGARLFNRFWRKMGEASGRFQADDPFLGIIINQWRDKIGAFSPRRGVTPQTSPGGHGKDYAYYCRVNLKLDGWLTEARPNYAKPVQVGQVIRVDTIKNKQTAPRQYAYVNFYFRNAPYSGFLAGDYDLGRDYADTGVITRIIQKKGGWYHYGGQQWNGIEKVYDALREDKGLRTQLGDEVITAARDPKIIDAMEQASMTGSPVGVKRVRRSRKDRDEE